MSQQLTYYTEVLGIVGDILRVRAKDVGFGDLAVVENWDGSKSYAQVVELEDDSVSLQLDRRDVDARVDVVALFAPGRYLRHRSLKHQSTKGDDESIPLGHGYE